MVWAGVPERNYPHLRMARIIAENAQRGRLQQQMPGFDHRQTDPSRRQDGPEMAVREKRDIARHRQQPRDQPVGAV